MSFQRLYGRLTRLEAQRRPWVVADVLRRARQCVPSELRAFLLAELTGRAQATFDVIMAQLTDAELEALAGLPGMFAFLETIPASEPEAVARGDPAAIRRCQRALKREGDGRP